MADQQNPGQTPPSNPYEAGAMPPPSGAAPADQGQTTGAAGTPSSGARGGPNVSGAVHTTAGAVTAAEAGKGLFGRIKGFFSSSEKPATTEHTAAPANPPAGTANPSAKHGVQEEIPGVTGEAATTGRTAAPANPPAGTANPSAPATGTPANAANPSAKKHWVQEEIPGVTGEAASTGHTAAPANPPAGTASPSGLRNTTQRIVDVFNKEIAGKAGATPANLLGAGGGVAIMANARKRESRFAKVTQTVLGGLVAGASVAAAIQGKSNLVDAGKDWRGYVSNRFGNSQGRGAP